MIPQRAADVTAGFLWALAKASDLPGDERERFLDVACAAVAAAVAGQWGWFFDGDEGSG